MSRHICGRHRYGCPKPHRYSVPVEYVGIDAPLPRLKSAVTVCRGETLTVEDADTDTRFTFTHRGVPRAYTGSERVVRQGWLVLPPEDGA